MIESIFYSHQHCYFNKFATLLKAIKQVKDSILIKFKCVKAFITQKKFYFRICMHNYDRLVKLNLFQSSIDKSWMMRCMLWNWDWHLWSQSAELRGSKWKRWYDEESNFMPLKISQSGSFSLEILALVSVTAVKHDSLPPRSALSCVTYVVCANADFFPSCIVSVACTSCCC